MAWLQTFLTISQLQALHDVRHLSAEFKKPNIGSADRQNQWMAADGASTCIPFSPTCPSSLLVAATTPIQQWHSESTMSGRARPVPLEQVHSRAISAMVFVFLWLLSKRSFRCAPNHVQFLVFESPLPSRILCRMSEDTFPCRHNTSKNAQVHEKL